VSPVWIQRPVCCADQRKAALNGARTSSAPPCASGRGP
jgi:hypothetical protein